MLASDLRPGLFTSLAAAMLLALVMLGWDAEPGSAQETLRGTFHSTWGDPPTPERPSVLRFHLVERDGRRIRLHVDPSTLRMAGGAERLAGRGVRVEAEAAARAPGDEVRVRAIQLDPSVPGGSSGAAGAGTGAPLTSTAASYGSSGLGAGGGQAQTRHYVVLLCRFADSSGIGPRSMETYERWMGATYPGMEHFWGELSDGLLTLGPNQVVGWYDLPEDKEAYMLNNNDANLGLLTEDCTAAADDDVYFPDFDGVIMQFDSDLGCCSWGGTTQLNRDGVQRSYGAVWNASWADQWVYGHEIGHSLGLPHSSGPYGETYDSKWDVMSDRVYHDPDEDSQIGQHTNSHHKDALGWIPASRRFEPAPGTRQQVELVRTGQPTSGDGALMVVVPTSEGGDRFYTIEARRFIGYDSHLPGEAVILHSVDMSRWNSRSQVVDVDGNGDPNDEGAMWTAGEAFSDSVVGLTVEVEENTSSGFDLTVTRGWLVNAEVVGEGRVVDDQGTLDCPGTCSALRDTRGASVTLSAEAAPEWIFVEWEGDCSGTGTCELTLGGNRMARAIFSLPLQIVGGASPRPAVMGAEYADTLRATGGEGEIEWVLIQGSLPAGLGLGFESGVLSGVPEEAGDFSFTLRARSERQSVEESYSLTVGKPSLATEAVMDALLSETDSTLSDAEVHFLDLLGNRNGRLDLGDVRNWLADQEVLQ